MAKKKTRVLVVNPRPWAQHRAGRRWPPGETEVEVTAAERKELEACSRHLQVKDVDEKAPADEPAPEPAEG